MKKIELVGHGSIQITGLKFAEQEGTPVDKEGNVLKYVVEGKGTTKYVNLEGVEVPRNEVCKKLVIDGEDMVLPKFAPTTRIDEDVISVYDAEAHSNCELRAIEKSWYLVNAYGKVKEELEAGKAIEFPVVMGSGFKVWKGVLKQHALPNGKVCNMLFTVRGDIDKAIEQFLDDPIEFEMPVMGEQKQNISKLSKAIGLF
jgi:hypothetical protein